MVRKFVSNQPTGQNVVEATWSLGLLGVVYQPQPLLLLLLSTKLQTPTDRAKCQKPEGTSREGSPKKEKINRNEGKKDKNTI